MTASGTTVRTSTRPAAPAASETGGTAGGDAEATPCAPPNALQRRRRKPTAAYRTGSALPTEVVSYASSLLVAIRASRCPDRGGPRERRHHRTASPERIRSRPADPLL